MVRTGYDSVDHRPGADPAGQKVRVAGLCCSGMGSAKVTDDGTAPAIAAVAPTLIKSRRELIIVLPKAMRSAEVGMLRVVGMEGCILRLVGAKHESPYIFAKTL